MAEAQDTRKEETRFQDIWVAPLMNLDKMTTVDDLLKFYDDLLAFLAQDEYDEDLKSELDAFFSKEDVQRENQKSETDDKLQKENGKEKNPADILRTPKYIQEFEIRKADLRRMECGITIAGETSSGKTCLVNKLVGEILVTPKVRAATSKICRIRNSVFCSIECLDKEGNVVKKREFFQDAREMTPKLDSYTDVKTTYEEAYGYYYIDVDCPFRNLNVEEKVMIADTPGIGEADELTDMLMEILPNAVAFIFIIDVLHGGGVQEQGLVQILKAIVKARSQMPCFDPNDVLFVTNKWNLLTRAAKQNETEELWGIIFDKLNNVWPHLKKEHIFKLNLSEEKAECGTEEEKKEFRRFTEDLSTILEKTKCRRVEMHICLLKDTIRVIERGIESRILTATSDVENKESELRAMSTKLEDLNQTCSQIIEELEIDMDKSVKRLTEKMHNYINSSEGRDKILNPAGEKAIEDCFFVGKEIPTRLNTGIMQWMRGKNVTDEMEKIDQKISQRLKEVHLQLEEVQTSITGQDNTQEDTRIATVLKFVFTAPLRLPFCIVIGSLALVVSVLCSPLIAAYALLRTKSIKKAEIKIIYAEFAKMISKCEIERAIGEIFQNHFEHRIKLIFEEELPREITNTKSVITYLLYQRDRIVENLDTYLHLRDALLTLKENLQKHNTRSY